MVVASSLVRSREISNRRRSGLVFLVKGPGRCERPPMASADGESQQRSSWRAGQSDPVKKGQHGHQRAHQKSTDPKYAEEDHLG